MEGNAAEGTEGQQSPAQGDEGTEGQNKDYKALYEESVKESRKWEKRAKDNKAALDSMKQSKPKADPTVEERLAALEEENSALKAKSARSALVDSVAKATGVDRALVACLNGEDEDALTEQAQAIAGLSKQNGGAPKVPEAGSKAKPGKLSKKDILAIKDKDERLDAIAANIELFS